MSKSFDTKQMVAAKAKRRKSLDFAALYKTDEETSAILAERGKRRDSAGPETISSSKNKEETPKHNKSSSKKKNKNKNTSLDISHIEGQDLNVSNKEKITSTPYSKETSKPKESSSVKSIIKNSSAFNNTMESIDTPRSKKRNKSVSFMLDDNEETAVKKIKSNENSPGETYTNKIKVKSPKKDKYRKKKDVGKENNETNAQENNTKPPKPNKKDKFNKVTKVDSDTESSFAPNDSMENNAEAKKKFRNYRKHNKSVNEDITETENKEKKLKKKNKHLKQVENAETMETNIELQSSASENSEAAQKDSNNNKSKDKKAKKQKRRHKQSENLETESTNMEPKEKLHKKESEPAPEVIAEDLENLNIGDNAHTLTHLLDEMSVVDKNKKRKIKNKLKTGKDKNNKSPSVETTDLEKTDEGKEKVIWKKRKWNKDRKVETDSLLTSVIVENLPLKIIFDFRKVLIEHFSKLGLVKHIGIAEVYPNEQPKPVFTTTVHFVEEGAATQALEEDNSRFEGSRLRIRRPLPATETTLVVRSYGELSEQALSSMFLGAGRVRSIRHAIKGRKSMGTAFVELDGPESVERGIALAQDAKIGGKKIHVAKFEVRQAKKPSSTELGSGD